MLLVHKAHHPTAFMAPNQLSPPHHHKRNPSAPAAVVHVHPTKTPGLLSLSKPAAVSNRSQQHPRHSTPRQHKTKPAASTTSTGSNSTPEKRDQHQPRGRGGPPKDKSARNGSRARHEHGTNRQPSPTPLPPSVGQQQQTTPAAPAPSDNNTNNSTEAPSKPDASPSLPAAGAKQPVVLTDQPSGRLAKRRNNKRQATPQPLPFPSATPPKQTNLNNAGRSPSPVKQQQQQKTANVDIKKGGHRARPTSVTNIPLSRSVPIPSNVHVANRNRRNRKNGGNFSDLDVFPICDDNDEEYDTEPTTPTRPTGAGAVKRTGLGVTWQTPTIFDFSDPEDDSGNISFGENGPRTAPLSSQQNEAKHYFPSPVPSPSPRSRQQQQQTQHGSLRRQRPSHARMTSYPTAHQVFNVSADELLSFPHAATPPLGGATTATPVKSMGSKNDILALFGLLDKNGNAFSTPSPASASADGARPRTISGNNAHINRGNGNVIGGGLYASSTFQNSPSPEALPPPDLVFGEGDDLFGQN